MEIIQESPESGFTAQAGGLRMRQLDAQRIDMHDHRTIFAAMGNAPTLTTAALKAAGRSRSRSTAAPQTAKSARPRVLGRALFA